MLTGIGESNKGLRLKGALWTLLAAGAALGWQPLAHAQTACGSDPCTIDMATTGETCAYERGATGCTANDFVSGATAMAVGQAAFCTKGQLVTNFGAIFSLASGSATRYAVGLFVGEQGQDLTMASPQGDTCSVATFPTQSITPPSPWFANTAGDACGSYAPNFTSNEQITGLTITCDPDPVTGVLRFPYVVVYANNAMQASACTGPGDVTAGTSSKCVFGGVDVPNVTVQYQANPTCSFAGTGDGFSFDNGTFTKTFTITNNGPDDAGVPGSNAVSFDDPVPTSGAANVTVSTAVCGNALGGAACPAAPLAINSNDVSGTIPTLPNGGSVDITITGTYTPGMQVAFDNVVTLTADPNIIITPTDPPWVNTCEVQNTLPVKLQSFDVH